VFFAPPGGVLDGVVLTASSVSAVPESTYAAPLVLTGLSKIGKCPGTAISGSLKLTDTGSFANEGMTLSGTLDGQDVNTSFASLGAGSFAERTDGFVLYYQFLDDGVVALGGFPPQQGAIRMPKAMVQGNSVLCVGFASVKSISADNKEITLSGLSLAGKMPGEAISGSLSFAHCSQ
jgi:hypothetical protein